MKEIEHEKNRARKKQSEKEIKQETNRSRNK